MRLVLCSDHSTLTMPRLYLFNPGHEEALRAPRCQSYTPPKVVRQMMYYLYELSYLLMERGDYVLRPKTLELNDFVLYDYEGREVSPLAVEQTPLSLEMWALEPFMSARVEAWASRYHLQLSWPPITEAYYQLSHRSLALELLNHLSSCYPTPKQLYPRWFYGEEEPSVLQRWVQECASSGALPLGLMLKRPFTSSGRGVMELSSQQAICEAHSLLDQARRGGGISLEPRLEVVCNYALLFYLSRGEAKHRYISTFDTDPRGGTAYTSNLLIPQCLQRSQLECLLPTSITWEEWIEAYNSFLREHVAPHYSGWVGVDLFSYIDREGALRLHPCVEINLRCTMGVLAAKASEILPVSQSKTAHFGIERPSGHGIGFSAYVLMHSVDTRSSVDISERTSIFALHQSRFK